MRIKAVMIVLIVLCLLYFSIGFVGVNIGWFGQDRFLSIGQVVGSVASVLGLASLAQRSLTNSEIESLDEDLLGRATSVLRRVKELESTKNSAEREINELEIRRAEMEILVRRASAHIFLKDRRQQLERAILRHVESSSDLREYLEEIAHVEKRIEEFELEIDGDPNVELLRQVIHDAAQRRPTMEDIIDAMPSTLMKAYFVAVIKVLRVLVGTDGPSKRPEK